MRVAWLRTAPANLDAEASFIAADNPKAPRLIVHQTFHSVALLAEQPHPGRVFGTHELLVPNTRYRIPYRVRDRQIDVRRVFHMSRRRPERWCAPSRFRSSESIDLFRLQRFEFAEYIAAVSFDALLVQRSVDSCRRVLA